MCGRFTQTKSRDEVIAQLGGIELPPLFLGRFNIAPAQKIAIIHQADPARAREAIWGFPNPRSGGPIINARCETLNARPMFRDLLPINRCLIPADGFYEWKGRQSYYFQRPDRNLFVLAGLCKDDRCVIVTRAADANMRGLHDRMPVIFETAHWASWLKRFEIPNDAPSLTTRPVSPHVNSVANDDPTCLEPSGIQTELGL